MSAHGADHDKLARRIRNPSLRVNVPLRSVLSAQSLLLASHAVLIAAVTTACVTATAGTLLRTVFLIVTVSPLLAGLPGLWRRRLKAYQWLALLMVLFAGFAAMEVVATLGRSWISGIILLASLLEIALLYILRRQAR